MSADVMPRTVLVTGGKGFIGSALCRRLAIDPAVRVINLDKLTYAASPDTLREFDGAARYRFVQGDIGDARLVRQLLHGEHVTGIVHLAAESHVDRSIDAPAAFIDTNITGTFRLLDEALHYWQTLDSAARAAFRFVHVSTDEVFGDLAFDTSKFDENSRYCPSSPYSATKAASDHLARAWGTTYGLPVIVTNCSNNYGPYQFPEKLIPLTILRAWAGQSIPVYGTGANIRDWLYVDDHATALEAVLTHGRVGQTYAVGASEEHSNVAVVAAICDLLDDRERLPSGRSRRTLIEFVADRSGHDRRYAIDATRIRQELNWRPTLNFRDGLAVTIDWYLNSAEWWQPLAHATQVRQGNARHGALHGVG